MQNIRKLIKYLGKDLDSKQAYTQMALGGDSDYIPLNVDIVFCQVYSLLDMVAWFIVGLVCVDVHQINLKNTIYQILTAESYQGGQMIINEVMAKIAIWVFYALVC